MQYCLTPCKKTDAVTYIPSVDPSIQYLTFIPKDWEVGGNLPLQRTLSKHDFAPCTTGKTPGVFGLPKVLPSEQESNRCSP